MNLGPTKRNCASVAFSATAPAFFSPFATSARRRLPVVGKSLRRERSGWQRCRPVCPTLSTTLAKVSVRKPQKIYDNMFQLQCRRPRLVSQRISTTHMLLYWRPSTKKTHGHNVAPKHARSRTVGGCSARIRLTGLVSAWQQRRCCRPLARWAPGQRHFLEVTVLGGSLVVGDIRRHLADPRQCRVEYGLIFLPENLRSADKQAWHYRHNIYNVRARGGSFKRKKNYIAKKNLPIECAQDDRPLRCPNFFFGFERSFCR